MNEMRLPLAITGSAVGLVSVIGFTPDIFAGPAIGALMDRDPGAVGHHHVFLMMAAFALIGLIASLTLLRLTRAAKREGHRSDGRSVGEEGVSKGRYRGWPYLKKKQQCST